MITPSPALQLPQSNAREAEREGGASGWQTGSCYYGRSTQRCVKSLQCSLVQQFQHAQGSPCNRMGLDEAPNPLRIQTGLVSFFLGSAVHVGHTHKNFTNKQIYFEYVPQYSMEVYYHWNSIRLRKSPSCPTGHFVLH